ncbi:MAG: DUF3841 domain-containing protein [Lactobacillus sp.]|nr:DUF3841 domain-containing protein [Lactobacillus sp.]
MRVFTVQPPTVMRQIQEQGVVYSVFHKAIPQQRHWHDFKRPYQFIYQNYGQRKHYTFGWDQGLFWAYDRFDYFSEGYYRAMAANRASRYLLTLDIPDETCLAFNSSAWNSCLNHGNLLQRHEQKPEGYDWALMFAPNAVQIMAADYRLFYPEDAAESDETLVGTVREVVFPYIRAKWVQKAKHFRGKRSLL